MSYGIKTPDGLGLHRVVDGNIPTGLDPAQFWAVDDSVPESHYWTGKWELRDGVACKVSLPVPVHEPTPEEVWQDKLAGRIVDPVTGIPLEASIAVRDTLASMLVLLREAELAGAITPETMQTIWDADGIERTMTVADLRGLLLRYGFAWQQMFAEYAP